MFKYKISKSVFSCALALSVLGATASYSASHKSHDMSGDMGHMSKMMQHMHDQMHGESGHRNMKDGMGMMRGPMMKMLDADGDDQVTPEEASEQLQAKLKEYDADGNGSLSIAEYEALHSAMIREKMVDRFQHLDADGDGQITSAEMDAPAQRIKKMQKRRATMQSGGMSKHHQSMEDTQSETDQN